MPRRRSHTTPQPTDGVETRSGRLGGPLTGPVCRFGPRLGATTAGVGVGPGAGAGVAVGVGVASAWEWVSGLALESASVWAWVSLRTEPSPVEELALNPGQTDVTPARVAVAFY
jgi:hypothetical protein